MASSLPAVSHYMVTCSQQNKGQAQPTFAETQPACLSEWDYHKLNFTVRFGSSQAPAAGVTNTLLTPMATAK